MDKIKAAILDCETTGISKSDAVIELAWLGLPELDQLSTPLYGNPIEHQLEKRYRPKVPIHPAAQAVHGISLSDLADCPASEKVINDAPLSESEGMFWIGHKIDFDKRMIAQTSKVELDHVKVICTHSLATRLLTETEKEELPDLKLTTLAKFFFPDFLAEVDKEGHSAMGDCTLVLMVLDALVKRTPALSWSDLHAIANAGKKPASTKKPKDDGATLLECWPNFGKHKGELFSSIPTNYLSWARDNLDFTKSKNLLFTINHWIGKH